MNDTTIHHALIPEALRDVMSKAGYRVERVKLPEDVISLRSATGGLAFEVRFANQLTDQSGAYADAVFQAVFQVDGELPLDLVNRWNATRRFGRLYVLPRALLLNMDTSVLGGVTSDYLRAQIEIWDRLVQQFLAYLREEVPKLAALTPTEGETMGTPAAKADAPMEAEVPAA